MGEREEEEKAKEAILEQARKHHVRPWDVGKEGVKELHVYSQEEWVDKKRKERPNEFAPPSTFRKNFQSEYNPEEEVSFSEKGLFFSSKKDSKQNASGGRRQRNMDSYETKEEFDFTQPSSSSFVSEPIIDECQGDDRNSRVESSPASESCDSDEEVRGKGVEVEPPPTFDYYGPSDSKRPKTVKKNEKIIDSIGAGLQFLRHQSEKKEKSKKHPEEMFLF